MADTLFDKVLKNVDIVDVVSKYVKLEPKGANLFGLCPFHNDNHPSMSVSKEKGIFYCFTCHTGGNAIKFIEKYKNLSSLDAALFLAKEYSIDISNEYQKNRNKNDVFYDILKESQDFFRIIMNNESYSAKAREYLYSRGINDSIINEFSIGLAPKDKNALTLMMLEKGYLESNLVEAGMSSNGLDIFKDRITIPIKDEQGKIIAFGARIYEKQDTAKYINSKETPIFSKSNVLFNLNNAIKYIKEKNRAILYEGYMDVIASYKTSIKEAVASMGTALTNEQAKLLHKYTSNCILAYDGDEAGFNAMNSAINILEKNGFIVKIALFNDKLDPDEYITKYGIQAFEDLINNKTVSKIEYFYERVKKDFGSLNESNFEQFKTKIFEIIKKERSRTILEIYLKKLSTDLDVSLSALKEDFNLYYSGKLENKKIVPSTGNNINKFDQATKILINYCLENYYYYKEISDKLGDFFVKDKELLMFYAQISNEYSKNKNVSHTKLMSIAAQNKAYEKIKLPAKYDYSVKELKELIDTMKLYDIETEIKNIEFELDELSKSETLDVEKYNKLFKQKVALKKKVKGNGTDKN